VAEHIAGYPQPGIRADREAAIGTFGLSIQEGLDLEARLCHAPTLSAQVAAEMQRFAQGSRPEPLRPVHVEPRR
jgi:hypothetical protein